VRKHLTNPAVYIPMAIVMVTVTVGVTLTEIGPAWGRWHHERTMARLLAWSPEPWAITVDDFPAGTATELPAEEKWLSPWGERTELALDPWSVPGLEPVLQDQLPYEYTWYRMRGVDRVTWSLNGVRIGDTDVFSVAITPAEGSFDVDDLGSASRRVQSDVVVDEETGERFDVVGATTVAGDAFVAVGTVTPVGMEPDVDAVELLGLLAAKVEAEPPVSATPTSYATTFRWA
jgi:hypothetical protein